MVLVVDDDADSREVTAAFLRASGFEALELESAEAALPHVRDAQVIVTDITLPGMSGYELAAKLRSDEATRNVILFALSGRSDATPEQTRLFDRIIVKPFDPDALVRALQEATEGLPPNSTRPRSSSAVSVAEKARAARELDATHYRLLVEHAPMLIWGTGLDGGCDYFNETWAMFTGRPIEQCLGDAWLDAVHPEDVDACRATRRANFERRTPFEMEYRLQRHDGVYRTVLDRGTPVKDGQGRFSGYVGSCIDVDDRARADRAKTMFLGMMAHEMRTPLTPLRAYQVQMQRALAKGEPIGEELVKRTARQVDRLAALVEHLGDAARLSANRRVALTKEPQDFSAIVRRAAEHFQDVLAARHDMKNTPTLEVIGVDVSRPVLGDKKRLEQMASALVENAVKFSPNGGHIRVQLDSADGRHRLVVTDEGIGIPREEVSAVGRPYFRASNAPPDNYPGLGLGLAVAREIAGAHGGTLTVESTRGVKATITLPADEAGA